MAGRATPGLQAVATGFGLLMAVAVAAGTAGPALVFAVTAIPVVLVATVFRPAATLAVLCAVIAIAASDAGPDLVALSGLCATAYLVLRHAAGTLSTAVAAVGFSFVGLVAAAFPLQLPWVPLLAPLAAFGGYLLVTRPFLGR